MLADAEKYPELKRSLSGIRSFLSIMDETRERMDGPLDELYDFLLQRSGYVAMLESKDLQENITRMENVLELKTNIKSFMAERGGTGSLPDFLDEMALYSDTDDLDAEENRVALMTMHSAKGLEFPTVFIAGAEDGLFPGMKSIGDDAEMEEERRLCYVAITRARQKLYITNAKQRMVFGRTQNNMLSRFVSSVPEDLLERLPKERSGGYGYGAGASAASAGEARPASENRANTFRSPYARKKPAPVHLSDMSVPKTPKLSLSVGDSVVHSAFGSGTVLNVRAVGPDSILEIAFEKEGTKKLMLSSAGKFLKKV